MPVRRLLTREHAKKWQIAFFTLLVALYVVARAGEQSIGKLSHEEAVFLVGAKAVFAWLSLGALAAWLISRRVGTAAVKTQAKPSSESPPISVRHGALQRWSGLAVTHKWFVLAVLALVVMGYWYILRPSWIRERCYEVASHEYYSDGGRLAEPGMRLRFSENEYEQCLLSEGLAR